MPAYPMWRKVWGEANALLYRARVFGWVDILIVLSLGGLLYGLLDLAREWTGASVGPVDIDISPAALPRYTFYSLARGLVAYCISLAFTLGYGYWAAKDPRAQRVLIPLLDILQSIPVLGFLPGLLLVFTAAFPQSNIGLELASIFSIFTGQAWNMTFSFYHSVRSVPLDQREVATVYRFSKWQWFKWLELPFSAIGLVWNSMMSMAGGWFFLMLSESFQSFRLPGLGSYMKTAVEKGDGMAQILAILAMVLMIVGLDQFLWRPVVVWAQKFRVEEGVAKEAETSWFLNWLRRSQLLAAIRRWLRSREPEPAKFAKAPLPETEETPSRAGRWEGVLSVAAFLALITGLCYGSWLLLQLVLSIQLGGWAESFAGAGATLGRVLLSTLLGTLWALPAGLAIGLSPRLSRILQPVVQVVASFPAPMLFPLVIAAMQIVGGHLGWWSILLMLLGTQWYILFNVVAGAMAIPADLREAAHSYRLRRLRRFGALYFPAVFPFLVTGWVTAAGGAWNTSIVAEYYEVSKDEVYSTFGLGAMISDSAARASLAADEGKDPMPYYSRLAAAVTVMVVVVVLFNRTVWHRLYRLAEERFALNK
jgi:NitT/TauT family transport system permease protein